MKDIMDGARGLHGNIIHEISSLMLEFQPCSFSFERRESNFEAHGLTEHALGHTVGRHIWLLQPLLSVASQ